MKKILLILSLALVAGVIVLWFVNLSPAIGSELVRDPYKYMEINDSTQKLLDDRAEGILPQKTVISLDNCVYEYSYECRLFGEVNCSIYLKSDSVEEKTFEEECKRIQKISSRTFNLVGGKTLYSVGDELEKQFDYYTDDKTEDGRTYIFELAVVDEDNKSIEYLFAIEDDGHGKSDIIVDLAEKIQE